MSLPHRGAPGMVLLRRRVLLLAAVGAGLLCLLPCAHGGGGGWQTCAAQFELWANTSCGGGSGPLQTLHLPSPEECCAACGGTARCLAWEFRNNTASGMPIACLLLTNPGTPGKEVGTTCGVFRDTPPGAVSSQPATSL